MAPCKSTAEEVSFDWSRNTIYSTDPEVTATLHVSVIDSDLEVKGLKLLVKKL